jgi:hypothetical protein
LEPLAIPTPGILDEAFLSRDRERVEEAQRGKIASLKKLLPTHKV